MQLRVGHFTETDGQTRPTPSGRRQAGEIVTFATSDGGYIKLVGTDDRNRCVEPPVI